MRSIHCHYRGKLCLHRHTACISLHVSVCLSVCISLCVFQELETWVESGEQVWKDDQSKVFKKMP